MEQEVTKYVVMSTILEIWRSNKKNYRQAAAQIGVSSGYLHDVIHGRRDFMPLAEKVGFRVETTVKIFRKTV